MTAPIDLDRLEQLAAQAVDGLISWWDEDEFAEGFPAPPEVDGYLAACDPATVAALVRAVKAAERHAQICDDEGPGAWDTLRSFREALAAVREQTG
jgi:hypothetical protein